MNAVKIDNGSYFSNITENSVLVEKSFAEYHHLKAGDTLSLVISEQPRSFEISGIASSPEYIFAAKSRQELLIICYGFPLFNSLQAGFAVKGACRLPGMRIWIHS